MLPASSSKKALARFQSCSLQILKSAVLFPFELLDQIVELSVLSVDLLLNHVGSVLKVAAKVTHRTSPPSLNGPGLPHGFEPS